MIRGVLWLAWNLPFALWKTARFLYCFLGPWHDWVHHAPACGCRAKVCTRCGYKVDVGNGCMQHYASTI